MNNLFDYSYTEWRQTDNFVDKIFFLEGAKIKDILHIMQYLKNKSTVNKT